MDDVEHLRREAEPDQRAPHGLRHREDAVDPQREPLAQLAPALGIAGGVARADARGARAPAVAGAVAQREVVAEQVVPRASQPVVVGREDRADAPRERLVDQREPEVVQVVEVHDVGLHPIEDLRERRPDRRIVELAMGMAQVEQPVRSVVHRHDLDAVLDDAPQRVGRLAFEPRHAGREHRHLVAALRELLGDVARDDRAAAGVGEPEGREHDALSGRLATGAPRRARLLVGAGSPLRRERGQVAGGERLGENEARAALGPLPREHGPVELGHEVVERPVREVLAQRGLDLVQLLGSMRLVGEVRAVAAVQDQRPAGDVAEAERPCRPQPVVEVVAHRERAVVAPDGVVHPAMQHRARVDDVVEPPHEQVDEDTARVVAGAPRADRAARAVDRDRVAVHDAGLGMTVEDGDLTGDPVGERDVVVTEAGDELAASLLHDRVVGGRDAAVGLVAHHAQPIAGELLEQRRRAVGRAIVDDQHLEIGVRLREAALDRLTDERLAVPGGDGERDSRTRGLHAPCIGNVLLPLENGARTRLES